MKKNRRPLIIGNWKMNPISLSTATKLGRDLKKKLGRHADALVAIAPPFVYIDALRSVLASSKHIALAAQDATVESSGSYTSQISLSMLQDLGVRYVILGHSERRKLGETDAAVNAKLAATIKAGMTGVVCVGESVRDPGGQYLSLVEEQVRRALAGIGKAKLAHVAIAYEPLWAIGTGMTATPADVHEMKLFIERILTDLYGRAYARRVYILYGGSVNEKNAGPIYIEGAVDGFLVGGASLKPDDFTGVVKATA